MSKKVLIISSSLRGGSNSECLARECERGAKDAGHDVQFISLKGKELKFCIGCLSCQETGKCVLKDDAADIMSAVYNAEVIVFSTPIYYYEMCGQLKTLLDRMNPLFPSDYKFRDIYMIATATEDEPTTFDKVDKELVGVCCRANYVHNVCVRCLQVGRCNGHIVYAVAAAVCRSDSF